MANKPENKDQPPPHQHHHHHQFKEIKSQGHEVFQPSSLFRTDLDKLKYDTIARSKPLVAKKDDHSSIPYSVLMQKEGKNNHEDFVSFEPMGLRPQDKDKGVRKIVNYPKVNYEKDIRTPKRKPGFTQKDTDVLSALPPETFKSAMFYLGAEMRADSPDEDEKAELRRQIKESEVAKPRSSKKKITTWNQLNKKLNKKKKKNKFKMALSSGGEADDESDRNGPRKQKSTRWKTPLNIVSTFKFNKYGQTQSKINPSDYSLTSKESRIHKTNQKRMVSAKSQSRKQRPMTILKKSVTAQYDIKTFGHKKFRAKKAPHYKNIEKSFKDVSMYELDFDNQRIKAGKGNPCFATFHVELDSPEESDPEYCDCQNCSKSKVQVEKIHRQQSYWNMEPHLTKAMEVANYNSNCNCPYRDTANTFKCSNNNFANSFMNASYNEIYLANPPQLLKIQSGKGPTSEDKNTLREKEKKELRCNWKSFF